MRGCVPFCWPCAGARTLAPLWQGLLGRPGLFGKPCIGQALLVGPSAGVIRPAIAWLPRGGARAPGRVPSNLAPVVFSAATKCRGLFGASIVRKKCPCSKKARLRCPPWATDSRQPKSRRTERAESPGAWRVAMRRCKIGSALDRRGREVVRNNGAVEPHPPKGAAVSARGAPELARRPVQSPSTRHRSPKVPWSQRPARCAARYRPRTVSRRGVAQSAGSTAGAQREAGRRFFSHYVFLRIHAADPCPDVDAVWTAPTVRRRAKRMTQSVGAPALMCAARVPIG